LKKPEKLGEDNAWFCSVCKKHLRAKKKMEIYKTPAILILQLKRFKSSHWSKEKLSDLVKFPLQGLDLSQYVIGQAENPPIYDLYAVSNHYGNLGFGHYTAFAYNNHHKKWFRFDDSHVTEIEDNDVCSAAAYTLFYRRRDIVENGVDYEMIRNKLEDENVEETKGEATSVEEIHASPVKDFGTIPDTEMKDISKPDLKEVSKISKGAKPFTDAQLAGHEESEGAPPMDE